MDRQIRIYTGRGGMELVNEAFEDVAGLKRVYIGKKVLRILRRKKREQPHKSHLTDRYYYLRRK